MGCSSPWDNSLGIIALDPLNNNCYGLTKWDLIPIGPTLFILFPFIL